MPIYVYACHNPECQYPAHEVELNVPVSKRDEQVCDICGAQLKRKVAFTGLTWAPTAGGMR